MWRDAWFIARKDVQYLIRKRETILWTFVMPIVFFYFIGTITGGFSVPGMPGADPVLLSAPVNAGFMVEPLAGRLGDAGFAVVRGDTVSPDAAQGYLRRLTVPDHFTDSLFAGRDVALEFRRRGEGLGSQYDVFRAQRAGYTLLADLVVAHEEGPAVTQGELDSIAAAPRNVKIDVSSAGRRKQVPTGFSQAIPGTMVMFTLMVLLTSGAVLLVVERRQGLLRRLAATPISRGALVLGKWGGRMMLASVQVGFAMIVGTVLFRMDWGPSLPIVIVLLVVYAGFTAALGILLGAVARTESQAIGIGVLSANLLAALGGCWWPIEVTPSWMQHLALFLPTGVAMDALHKLVNFQLPPGVVLPHVVALAALGVAAGWVAARVFRYD
jgi:ABC-type Na+ efflux pump permease subunit